MARQRNCRNCKKELTGKYYILTGVGGYEASRANFCSLCCDVKKNISNIRKLIEEGEMKVVEKEVGDKLMDDISDFEDKWEKNTNLGITKIILPDNKTFLNSIRQARQELEPYLQKPKIVEKAWLREYDTNIVDMEFHYLFGKSARDKDYKQKVVQTTVEEILGGKIDEEINTTTVGNAPDTGNAEGKFKINGKIIGKYKWTDHWDDCRRLWLLFSDNNEMVLQAFLRALDIKEKELKKGVLPENPDKSPFPTPPKSTNQPDPVKPTNRTPIISLTICGALFIIFGIVIFLIRTKKRKVKKSN